MCNEKEYELKKQNWQKDCIPYEEVIYVDELARAYVPFQKYCDILSPTNSLIRGTVFPELYKPYCKKDKECKKCNPLFNGKEC